MLCSGAADTAGADTGAPGKGLGAKQAQSVLSYCSEAAVCSPSCAVCAGLRCQCSGSAVRVPSRETLRITGNE